MTNNDSVISQTTVLAYAPCRIKAYQVRGSVRMRIIIIPRGGARVVRMRIILNKGSENENHSHPEK